MIAHDKLIKYYMKAIESNILFSWSGNKSNTLKQYEKDSFCVNAEEIWNGQLSYEHECKAIALVEEYEKYLIQEKIIKKGEKVSQAPVVAAPNVIVQRKDLTYSSPGKPVVWLVGVINKNGKLNVGNKDAENYYPATINRNLLQPSHNDDVVIGDYDDYVKILQEKEYAVNSWEEQINYIADIFKKLSNQNLLNWVPDGYSLRNGFIQLCVPQNDSKTIILNFCKSIRKHGNYSLTYKNLNKKKEKQSSANNFNKIEYLDCYLGHMSSMPLNIKQRDAVIATMLLKTHDLQAINGPPGTGKTTLIKSIVASKIVHSALNKQLPHLIFVSSAINQAITNVIDSFCEEEKQSIVNQRWIYNINSYAIYEASGAVLKEHGKNYQTLNDVKLSTLSKKNIEESIKLFISNSSKYFNVNIKNLKQSQELLHEELQKTTNYIKTWKESTIELRNKGINSNEEYICYVRSQDKLLEKTSNIIKNITEKIFFHEQKKKEITLQLATKRKKIALYKIEGSLIEDILSFLSIMKRRQANKYYRYLIENDIELPVNIEKNIEVINTYLQENLAKEQEDLKTKITNLQDGKQHEIDLHQQCFDSLAFINNIYIQKKRIEDDCIQDFCNQDDELNKMFDVKFRYKAFHLAMRYYESVFLLNEQIWRNLIRGNNGYAQEYESKKTFLQYLACLAPCTVATIYKLVASFGYYNDKDVGQTLAFKDGIDLIIFDEAGMIPPELSLPILNITKNAVAIGDLKQLKPITNISPIFDLYTINKVSDGKYEKMEKHGFNSSSGSLMKAIQNFSSFIDNEGEEKGIMLLEHYRCDDRIIAYNNDLCYGGRLLPRVGERQTFKLPPLVCFHTEGNPRKSGTSWHNEKEAEEIVKWIIKQKSYLPSDKCLADVIAVICPFSKQSKIITNKLWETGLITSYLRKKERIIVGTVHALQGAEKEIIIFSPTVTQGAMNGQTPFFDKGTNMLNVAVSRAKSSFVIVGDKDIFFKNQNKHAPSAILGKYLEFSKIEKF